VTVFVALVIPHAKRMRHVVYAFYTALRHFLH
jgi:hypothetical protein